MTKAKKGFTLIELVITIAIIAIVSAITIPVIYANPRNANKIKDGKLLSEIADNVNQTVDGIERNHNSSIDTDTNINNKKYQDTTLITVYDGLEREFKDVHFVVINNNIFNVDILPANLGINHQNTIILKDNKTLKEALDDVSRKDNFNKFYLVYLNYTKGFISVGFYNNLKLVEQISINHIFKGFVT